MITRSPQGSDIGGWRQQLQDAVRQPAELLQALDLEDSALAGRVKDSAPFPLAVPRPFLHRMEPGNPDDPLLLQVLPLRDEEAESPGFVADPVGDLNAAEGRGIIHKYHGRVLLVTTGACAIHCRYCFRREFPYSDQLASRQSWGAAVDYLKQHRDISEVILSGGDPLSLATGKLRSLTDALKELDHLETLRIHTRLPVVLPGRITADLLDWLQSIPLNKVMVIHANHANEFDHQVDHAIAQLRAVGVTVLNQAVLLRRVNDSAPAQMELARRGFRAGVLPYYLHLLDRVSGTAHFEVSSEQASGIMEQLRRQLPGYLVPRLVREAAGAPYKLPVM